MLKLVVTHDKLPLVLSEKLLLVLSVRTRSKRVLKALSGKGSLVRSRQGGC